MCVKIVFPMPSLYFSINVVTVPRRALRYLRDLAKEVFCHHSEEPSSQPAADEDGSSTGAGAEPKSVKGKKGPVQNLQGFMYKDSILSVRNPFIPFKLSLILIKKK